MSQLKSFGPFSKIESCECHKTKLSEFMRFNLFATINYYNQNLTVKSLQASSSPATANYCKTTK